MTSGSEFWGPAGLLSPRCMAAGCSPAVDGERKEKLLVCVIRVDGRERGNRGDYFFVAH